MERADKRGPLGRSDSWPPLEIFRGAYGDERDAPAPASKIFSFLTFPKLRRRLLEASSVR